MRRRMKLMKSIFGGRKKETTDGIMITTEQDDDDDMGSPAMERIDNFDDFGQDDILGNTPDNNTYQYYNHHNHHHHSHPNQPSHQTGHPPESSQQQLLQQQLLRQQQQEHPPPPRGRPRQQSYGIPKQISTRNQDPASSAIVHAAAVVTDSFHSSSSEASSSSSTEGDTSPPQHQHQQQEPSSQPSPSQTTTNKVPAEELRNSLESTQSAISVNTTVFDDASSLIKAYEQVPSLELTKLPRGGISMETEAVGRVQFGIPPETIKDSMRLGLAVPAVYIVPVERFCREMGPALGVNLAEFEFPAYFNFFVYKKRCTLVVDSQDAEENIRRVFSETLLGPAQFRREVNPISYEEEDFVPEFPREMIPNFQKELKHFRIMPDGKELVLETLLNFRHFEMPGETAGVHENLGIPPPIGTPNQQSSNGHVADSQTNTQEKGVIDTKREEEEEEEEGKIAADSNIGAKSQSNTPQARWNGDVATVWPVTASEEDIKHRRCKRVEIFKMPGGTEYVLHDIDENNHIVGKARFSGHVKVSKTMAVDGFGGKSMLDEQAYIDDGDDKEDDEDEDDDDDEEDREDDDNSEAMDDFEKNFLPPTFHPPSFGVTILGNSHGFDKSGSVSGYVLWINGRGVMIDPPPYSSATLEREGIRPRTIVGIILTHCHADHDAGAFQKVLTGSPVVVITTPTIYKSFIRKYAALSALSPALLRHSHRHKPAIIGQPLRFQGATFKFFYTLHTIPCVGFRVEWRGRSMVFTGDHLNSPPAIDQLQESGVLSKARADDLRNLALQPTDVLLHESGAPPIHTPLDVLLGLPQAVKNRLFVVHTSALPENCELRVAPTGTAGTIRLDQPQKLGSGIADRGTNHIQRGRGTRESLSLEEVVSSPWSLHHASNEYTTITDEGQDAGTMDRMATSFAHLGVQTRSSKGTERRTSFSPLSDNAPLVSLRPASSTDAWFILNLLSAVPFLTSLSYASTMEVLETARVDAYCKDEVIVPSSRRNHVLCVVWEGTCVEREKSAIKTRARGRGPLLPMREKGMGVVWYAGDWTGPIALQPEKQLSGESSMGATHDVVAMSEEGVKVITVEFSNLHVILKSGSALYRKYLERRDQQRRATKGSSTDPTKKPSALEKAIKTLNVLELLDDNSALRKLSAVQKRHLESLAEGPVSFQPGERLWRAGAPVDKAFIVVSGTASFVLKRRNAGSVGLAPAIQKQPLRTRGAGSTALGVSGDDLSQFAQQSLGESMRIDAITAIRELGDTVPETSRTDDSSIDSEDNLRPKLNQRIQLAPIFSLASNDAGLASSFTEAHDYAILIDGLQKRAIERSKSEGVEPPENLTNGPHNFAVLMDDDNAREVDGTLSHLDKSGKSFIPKDLKRRRSSQAIYENKVLGRLYTQRAFSGGLVFSRGHFLGDVSKMVAGLLSSDTVESDLSHNSDCDGNGVAPKYGFGEKTEGAGGGGGLHKSQLDDVIHEREGDELIVHSSTLTAGKDGCVVLVFPKASLIPFLDEYPGLLLSLLGTQVVV